MNHVRMVAFIAGSLALQACIAGCSSTTRVTVPVPPRMDLTQFHSIGLVTFSGHETDSNMRHECTQQFMRALQEAQPGTRIIELGDESRVLGSVECRKWESRAFAAVQKKLGLDAVILGQINVERTKPDVRLSTEWRTLSVKSDVNAVLTAKLVETASGATMWTDSAQMTTTVAAASLNTRGEGGFGSTDADAAYREMVGSLVQSITDDFRTHYITRRVPKEQVETASAESAAFEY